MEPTRSEGPQRQSDRHSFDLPQMARNRHRRIDRIDLSQNGPIVMISFDRREFASTRRSILNEHDGQFVPLLKPISAIVEMVRS